MIEKNRNGGSQGEQPQNSHGSCLQIISHNPAMDKGQKQDNRPGHTMTQPPFLKLQVYLPLKNTHQNHDDEKEQGHLTQPDMPGQVQTDK
jgi:hypothetical protein